MQQHTPLSRTMIVWVACAALIITVALSTDTGRALTSPLRALVRPIAGAVSSWAMHARIRRASDDALRRTQEALQEDVARLTAAARDLAVCREENDELKTLVQYAAPRGFATLSARILAQVHEERTRILIDQGYSRGVTTGAAVVTGDGIMVGRVQALDREFSVVALLTDATTAIPARIAGSAFEGILRRDTQGGIVLDLLPLDAVIAPGDIVLTAGLDERVPRDLVLGTVRIAERRAHAPFLHVEVSAIPLALRSFVFVIVGAP